MVSSSFITCSIFLSCVGMAQAFSFPAEPAPTYSGFSVHSSFPPRARSSSVQKRESLFNQPVRLLQTGKTDESHEVKKQSAGLTHSDIQWSLRPPKDSPWTKRFSVKAAANLIRLDCYVKRQSPPPVLCPKGGQSVLQAYYKEPGSFRKKQIARFGITTVRGPPAPMIDESIREIYNVNPPLGGAGVAAIIYMFVEKEYRKRGIGELALEAIAAIHAVQGVDFTVLVADDDGSGKLVEWYESNGFSRAPKLQDMMGSPNAKFGTTMIAPTSVSQDFFETCRIKWW